jgi:hypothetical protein
MLNYTTIHATIGKTFADKQDEVIFQSGNLVYTRRELVGIVGCANFIAAARLAKVCRRLKIYTITQLYKTDPYSLYRAKGIGDTAVYVAMCLLDTSNFNVMKWWNKKTSADKERSIRRAKRNKQAID